ncbi:MAG TPA: AMP-binding protein [Woeseiaceae bacterium]|nr:AMP-binding protein [Woeseiaceae bacterium]
MTTGLQDSVYRQFAAAVEKHAERPFLRAPAVSTSTYSDSAIEYSYAAALLEVQKLVRAWHSVGVRPSDRVALAYDSRLDVYLHLLALNALGASLVPLNMVASDEELAYFIAHSDTRMLTGANEYLERLSSVSAASGAAVLSAGDLAAHFAAGNATPHAQGAEATEAALLYTSGTTGKPKGCMLSNRYFLTMGREYNALQAYCTINSDDRLLTPLPPNHMNALATSFMAMMMCGGCVIQLDRFHPRSWWQTVREEKATVIHYLGVMPAILLTLPESDDDKVGSLVRFGFGAGSDPRHQSVFEKRFGFPLIEAWAMTESGGGGMIVANREPRHIGKRCVGQPIASMELRIVDKNDQDVPPGEDGELLVRHRSDDARYGFFSGYYKDEAATEAGWKGGWWHTGDVVRADDEGAIYFVDRQKNVIRRSGENIAAVEVEAALLSSDLVHNCAVTAVPDEIRGDEVFAFVVVSESRREAGELANAIFDHSAGKLTYFKTPGYIEFVDELPLTASQKVSRAEVKRLARQAVEDGTAIDMRARKKRQSV